MDILRIATAGSVDDGKSTLIGRLLYETKSITNDKLVAIEAASQRRGLDFLDLSLLTDGLIAEREQGITIDVANIYFNTAQRKYIIADTPGHFEYTRNMVTGASNVEVSIILIDSRNGVVEQTKRHFFISSMLRIKNIVVAINKMDLVNYDEVQFNKIKDEFNVFAEKVAFEGQNIQFVPLSSLYGENISTKSDKMNFYKGESLLGILESIKNKVESVNLPARFPVQSVIRPKTDALHDYRGYAGRIASGTFKVGDEIVALPSNQTSKIKTIEKFGTEFPSASTKESVVITLENDIDVSRGNLIAKVSENINSAKEIVSQICWLESSPIRAGKTYLLQHGINRVKSKIQAINNKNDINTFEVIEEVEELKLNEIGQVSIRLAAPIFADIFNENPGNGAFILIDEQSNNTVGVGLVVG
jgi:sulfate adenylyltransferase subunit 1